MKAYLVYQSRVFPINSDSIRLGRDLENTLVLSNSTVSRFHAEITLKDETYYLKDLGSTAGTHLNQIEVNEPVPLSSGDQISLAEVDLTFFTDPEDIDTTTKQRTTNLKVDEDQTPDDESAG